MKQIVRYRFMTIPNKLVAEIRITVDDKQAEYGSLFDGGKATNVALYPVINLQMLHNQATEITDMGLRRAWDANDSVGLTKFTMPVFIDELIGINEGMKTPDLYSYHGSRLELNEEKANEVRKVFMCGNATIEFCPILVEQSDGTRIEAVKMKFNTEKSSILLTLNEMTAVIYNLTHIDIDAISLQLYLTYVQREATRFKQARTPRVTDIDSAPLTKNELIQKDFKEFE